MPSECPNVIGSGGIYATAEDLCRLSAIFMQNEKSGTLSNELGWDSVETYPFDRYGIRALTKGGDISCYHAIKRIDRTEENPFVEKEELAAARLPDDIQDYAGWYGGRDVFQAEFKEDATMRLSSRGFKDGMSQIYEYREDGRFYGSAGEYLDATGGMSRGSSGQTGRTALEFTADLPGKTYLTAVTYETYPGLGSNIYENPVAEKLEEHVVDSKTGKTWGERQGRVYYLVSDKYSSTAYMNNVSAKIKVLQEPAGYLCFEQSKLSMAQLYDENRAEFFLQIPGQIGRDQYDYQMLQIKGKEYLDTGDMRMIWEAEIGELPEQEEGITIGENEESLWFVTKGQRAVIEVPEEAAFYIYHYVNKEMTCISSSYVLEKGQAVSLPQDGRIVFAGESGTEFLISYE